MDFEQFHFNEPLRRAVRREGFEAPTPIQAQAIPPALEGRDVVGVAQTGTGKTAAFLLPSMQRLMTGGQKGRAQAPRMVVLAPTRELALQITEHARRLCHFTHLTVATVYGGAPLGRQTQELRRGVDLVIATPGRLMDHMERRNVHFDGLEILVLDEADRMLDMGFLPDILSIVRRMPSDRQTMLFSATMPAPILALSRRFMRNPVRAEIENARPPEALRQRIYPVPKHLKLGLLIALLREAAVESTLVFTRTKQDADIVARKLREAGLPVAEMHGDFSQKERVRALEQFRAGEVRILVATNIAARGLDIEGISHVINFDVPEEAESYVHRIGRTARVEASGTAWTLATPEDEPLISAIERLLGERLERIRLPGFNYDVPTPDWAKPSRAEILRAASRNRSATARWKALTR
ncbi:MAG TPA: DEAD/DEAH box helicase [Anaerolineales bacterium]|nr:DEAD/DEAH box helicase [Anaerolineales bacterium]